MSHLHHAAHLHNPIHRHAVGKAKLTFDINMGRLHGLLAGKMISIVCASGGGGGAKGKLVYDDPGAVNNPFRTNQKADSSKGVRGGSIPPGQWVIAKPSVHKGLGHSAALTPKNVPTLGTRGGFYIHGRGKHGSDGCIVPVIPADFQRLLAGLTADDGGTLTVNGVIDIPTVGNSRFA